jgi:hypothetical protein
MNALAERAAFIRPGGVPAAFDKRFNSPVIPAATSPRTRAATSLINPPNMTKHPIDMFLKACYSTIISFLAKEIL